MYAVSIMAATHWRMAEYKKKKKKKKQTDKDDEGH